MSWIISMRILTNSQTLTTSSHNIYIWPLLSFPVSFSLWCLANCLIFGLFYMIPAYLVYSEKVFFIILYVRLTCDIIHKKKNSLCCHCLPKSILSFHLHETKKRLLYTFNFERAPFINWTNIWVLTICWALFQ